MYLTYHGGACCGMKHVWGLTSHPEYDVAGLYESDETMSGKARLYTLSAPMEPGKDRLKRYVDFLEKTNPQGILEVVTNERDGPFGPKQTSNWRATLAGFGFKEVSISKNSNTGNNIHVWHKVFDGERDTRRSVFEVNEEIRAERGETPPSDKPDPFA